jgi:carboxylesterase type B
MSPDGSTNFAVKDIISALTFLKKVVPSFGGNAAKITIAGQSSGANMVRALLAVPSASSLFQSGIIQSDPMVGIISCCGEKPRF